MSLTRRQREAMDFIRAEYDASGVSPTYEEICAALGLKSKASASRLVAGLVERGHLHRYPGRARSLTPITANRDAALGQIIIILNRHTNGTLTSWEAIDEIVKVLR